MKIWKYEGVKSALFFCIMGAVFEVLNFYILSFLITDKTEILIRNLILVCGTFLLSSMIDYLKGKYKGKAVMNLGKILSAQTDLRISNMKYSDFKSKNDGEYLSIYTNDIDKVTELVLEKFLSRVTMGATALSSFVALMMIHYGVGLLSISSLVIMALLPKLFQKKLSAYILGVQETRGHYTNRMREIIQGFSTFFESNAFHLYLSKSAKEIRKVTENYYQTSLFTSFMSAVLTFVNAVMTSLSVAILSYLIILGRVNPGVLVAVIPLMANFGNAVTQFMAEKEFYLSGLELYKEKFETTENFQKVKRVEDLIGKLKKKKGEGITSIRLRGVLVNYERKLTFPDLEIKSGLRYAIVGESGSGKSSLLKAILGELDHYEGEISINDRVKEKEESIFEDVAYVNQETYLFNDTVKDNIDLNRELTNDEVRKLLCQVGMSEINPEDKIEDNGKNLSGGQRQRLALARALARKKEVLFLDEATANLDGVTAGLVEELALKESKTFIMITHRLTNEMEKKMDYVIKLS